MEKKNDKNFDHKLMLQPDVSYAITINPDNEHQYLHMPKKDRFELCQTYLTILLKPLKKTKSEWQLYPEISDPDPNNKKGITRWHWHGVITFDLVGIAKYYEYLLAKWKESSMIEIKEIDCKETWTKYVLKNKDTMILLCEYRGIPYEMTKSVELKRLQQRVYDNDEYDEVITVERKRRTKGASSDRP